MEITDEYIDMIFFNDSFGYEIDDCVFKKRELLAESLRNQEQGLWTGSAMYQIMIFGGFLIDGKANSRKELTMLGSLFMVEEGL